MELNLSQPDRVHVSRKGALLFTYVVLPDCDPFEFNRPYLHPIKTLAGDVVTNDRPNDHAWHKGLSMTLTVVNDQNFWGGRTYVHGEGYVRKDNVGRTIHRTWLKQESSADEVTLAHRLDWQAFGGDTLMTEEREIRCGEVWETAGGWSLMWRSRLENVSGAPIEIGSPTTKGREKAGYGGWFLRAARDLHGGEVIADGDLHGEDEVNGAKARWVAYSGVHDGSLRTSTLVLRDHPDNPRYPTTWFVRSTQYAGVSAAFPYYETYTLDPGAVLDLRYRLYVLNGAWAREDINRIVTALW